MHGKGRRAGISFMITRFNNMSKKGFNKSIRDEMILKILYRLPWAFDWQIALLIGEPVKYVRGRLNQLVVWGLVERKKLIAGEEVLNYLTAEGCRVIGYEVKKKRVPKIGRFEHDLGVINSYLWLALKGIPFGLIVTEKAMNSAIEMKKVGTKWVRLGRDVHLPDGYILGNGKYFALEFERTKKNKTSSKQMISNVHDNSRRFHTQYWFVALDSIEEELKRTSFYRDGTLKIIRFDEVRKALSKAVSELPTVLSDKSGESPKVLFSEPIEAVPVAKLPIIGGVSFENMTKMSLTSADDKKRTNMSFTTSKTVQNKPVIRKRFES